MSQVSETTVDRPVNTAHMQVSSTNVAIEVIGMHKWYADFHVLRDINLKVMEGERIVIAGPSGSGKSTLIRCINRLEEHQEGQIIVNGTELTADLKRIDEVRREVGMVFAAMVFWVFCFSMSRYSIYMERRLNTGYKR